MIAAKVQSDSVQPCCELGRRPKFFDIEVGPHKSFHGQLQSVVFILHVTQDETKQPLPVPIHQGVERLLLAKHKRLHQGQIRIFLCHRAHCQKSLRGKATPAVKT
jgi:hypothetical protein